MGRRLDLCPESMPAIISARTTAADQTYRLEANPILFWMMQYWSGGTPFLSELGHPQRQIRTVTCDLDIQRPLQSGHRESP